MTGNYQIVQIQTTDFLNEKIRDFGIYVVHNRALPNIMDGMRVGARKILYAAIKNKKLNPADKSKKTKPTKMVTLIGDTMNLEWAHGDASLKNTIEQMCKNQYWKTTPLNAIGQISTMRVDKINTAARYLKIERTKYLEIFEHSSELWDLKIEENQKIEPEFLLPVIPIALVYRTNSPGFGFGYRAFSYNLDDIIDNMLTTLHYGTCKDMNYSSIRPVIEGIKNENIIYNSNIDAYFNVGTYKMIAQDTIQITDLPYNVSYEKYEQYLESLLESGTIREWKNLTIGNETNFHITFPTGRFDILVQQKLKFFKLLKLYTQIPKDTLNLIDIDGQSILNFPDKRDLIDTFVRRRLAVFEKQRLHVIDVLKNKLTDLQSKIDFIQLIISNKIEIRRKSKNEILNQCKNNGFDFSNTIDELLKLPIKRLTIEEIEKAKNEYNSIKEKWKYFETTTANNLFYNELIDFKIKYGKQIINKK